jgi:hypothetical protein
MHEGTSPLFWLTGNDCLFAARLEDEEGLVAYTRVDEMPDSYFVHVQFGPEDIVSKKRVALGLSAGIKIVSDLAKANGKKKVLTQSENPPLVGFLHKLGFQETPVSNVFQLSLE